MITFGLVVLAAAIALGLAMRTRLPASVLAIVAGVVLQVVSAPLDQELVRDGLLMATTFLVFAVGGEIDRHPLRAYRGAALALTALMILITALGAVGLWYTLRLDRWTVVYWVVALGASSTLLVFELLRGRQQFFEPLGRLVTATVVAQDLVVLVALAGFAALASESPWPLVGTVGLGVAAWALSRWGAPFVMLRLGLDEEERLLFVLLLLFAFAALARWSGAAVVVGAYFAGIALSRFPVGDLARGYLKSFSDFFATIFYVSLGLVVTLPRLGDVVAEVVFVTALLLVRPFVLLPLVRRTGLTVRTSIEAVTLLGQAGELAVVVAIVGTELGHVREDMLGMVAAVVVVTTTVAPWLSSDRATWRLTRWYPFRERELGAAPRTGHVVLLGCGETGSVVLEGLRDAGVEVVVIDEDPGVLEGLAARGVPVFRGDGGDLGVLGDAGADRARAVVSTMRRLGDNVRLLSTLRGPVVLVRVFSNDEADVVRSLGGQPIVEAEVAAEAFARWCGGPEAARGAEALDVTAERGASRKDEPAPRVF